MLNQCTHIRSGFRSVGRSVGRHSCLVRERVRACVRASKRPSVSQICSSTILTTVTTLSAAAAAAAVAVAAITTTMMKRDTFSECRDEFSMLFMAVFAFSLDIIIVRVIRDGQKTSTASANTEATIRSVRAPLEVQETCPMPSCWNLAALRK